MEKIDCNTDTYPQIHQCLVSMLNHNYNHNYKIKEVIEEISINIINPQKK